jgi:putative aldouronate transport system substrate-binding protein
MQNYGPDIIEMRGDDLFALRFGGTLYGVPVHKDDAAGIGGFVFGAQYLDEVGFNYESGVINKTTLDEIEQLMANLHTAFPDKAVIVPAEASMMQSSVIDSLGGDFFGELLDPINSLQVSNLFESQLYYDYCNMWYNWNQLGYLAGDALTNEMPPTVQVQAGTAMGYITTGKPGIVSQESSLIDMEAVVLQVGPDYKRGATLSIMPWVISVNTADEIAAMQLLNELYSNPELSRLYCWGREGFEYVVTPEGYLTFPEGVDAGTSGYLHNVNWQLPNQFIAGVWEGNPLSLWDDMLVFNDNALVSKALGFTFDSTALAAEFTALTNIYTEYRRQLEYGFLDPAVGIPEMVARMERAGLSAYITEKQAQLDAWAAANGIS